MATSRTIEQKGYCDEILEELALMIETVNDLRDEAGRVYGKDSAVFRTHDKHLGELAEYLDWKLQLLTTACPFEWKGITGVESVVSVRQPEAGPEISGGLLGG